MKSEFIEIEDEIPDKYYGQRVKSVSCVKLYYISDRRNAWYGTTVRRWYPESFFLTLTEAKSHAESQRVNGSVFYIREIPAICIETSKCYGLITSVSSDDPLSDFKYIFDKDEVIKKLVDKGYKLNFLFAEPALIQFQVAEKTQRSLLRPGNYFHAVVNAFHPKSVFWKTADFSRDDRLVRMILPKSAEFTLEKVLPRTVFDVRMSKAVGSNYLLSWNILLPYFKSKSIFRLIEISKGLTK